jgi:hypothetical protein
VPLTCADVSAQPGYHSGARNCRQVVSALSLVMRRTRWWVRLVRFPGQTFFSSLPGAVGLFPDNSSFWESVQRRTAIRLASHTCVCATIF